ncbi:Phosphotransferase system, HPr histidine phosphorylation site [Acididesulfobacillus acetoxydans]|uniref:Phosphocarrier protein HPr n=1 Tax=Acididesulfobacillus acetoxydans TaxID=1561005 RepID=A0A8S0W6S4_9FIRM|nr:HPr family phosphocarrier protein [Acididesulfobacillus acetoxydans]CAA7600119.1 Phosphotransferase system, HPr histidine phosphorylation site [Acididesulfobacillus acetoxydans]CAA7600841.1 Phosphotransferase system, HPr histidine phosphorylation site [Acididesulfobacillus acetoxydans]CEJ09257.1 Phosphocarrier protein signature [Acididesulfobacillus acetoxydans]CEJ09497.1 Phosphocarrier protein signature [Acididesulfobacillus acetoxydans]
MRTETVTILNETGLHARPASLFVQTASRFKAEVSLEKSGKRVTAKSILGVLSLGVTQGDQVVLTCVGPDEEEALGQLVELVHSKFGEKSEA